MDAVALETLLAIGDNEDVEADRADSDVAAPLHLSVPHGSVDSQAFNRVSGELAPARFYRRYGNPTTARLERLVAAAEGAEAGLAMASGMGATSCAVLALTSSGDHIVAQHSMYGGTLALLHDLADRFGVEVSFVDQTDTDAFAAALTPRTKLVMLETPSNPLLQLTDLAAVSALAHEHGALTMVDNTVATPINQRPIGLGVDLVMHSVTKALSGHADVQAGLVVGRRELIDRLCQVQHHLGAIASPLDTWLAVRGLRTLAMRVRAANRAAQAVAEHLAAHPRVRVVNHPGLPQHPQHELARRQMDGFGALLSFELDADAEGAETFLDALRLPVIAPSLGTHRSLVVRPAAMWSTDLSEQELSDAGVSPSLIRLAIGLEHEQDLIADLDRALAAMTTAT